VGYTAPPAVYAAAPYGVDPLSGLPYSDKSKLAAGLLGIFFGGLGVGRFYTGHVGLGVAQLLVSLVTFGVGALWGLIDGIMMLAGNSRDAQGRPLRP
jgi:TM2 domain-containing membrane protein YozV